GGSAVLIQYLDSALDFRKRFSIVTIKKGKNSSFSTIDMLFALLALMMLGCDRIFHINDKFKDDELLARQLGIVRIFDQSTASRFMAKFNKWHVNQVERILSKLTETQGRFDSSNRNELDIDASDLTRSSHNTEGAKPGKNKKNKGKDSYLISCGFSNNQVVGAHMTSGNVHCSQAMETVFNKAMAIMDRIDLLRLDAGYIGIDTLKWLLLLTVNPDSSEKMKFLVGCNGQADGVKQAKEYARKHPQEWVLMKKGEKKIHVMDFKNVPLFKAYPEGKVRLVLVRMNQKIKKVKDNKIRYHRQIRIYAIATNLTRGYGPRQIFTKYHKRQRIELMFRELKNSLAVGKLPSGNKNANYGHFLLCCLAYNTAYYFKRDLLPKKYQNRVIATIRRQFFEIPAKRLDTWNIEFNLNYRYKKAYERMINKLHRLICGLSGVVP
ncbi:MAG: transposase, partial [Desulfobacteraceae bacterium]|nr:transposase [Desulfobacteraceae bacterium]